MTERSPTDLSRLYESARAWGSKNLGAQDSEDFASFVVLEALRLGEWRSRRPFKIMRAEFYRRYNADLHTKKGRLKREAVHVDVSDFDISDTEDLRILEFEHRPIKESRPTAPVERPKKSYFDRWLEAHRAEKKTEPPRCAERLVPRRTIFESFRALMLMGDGPMPSCPHCGKEVLTG